MTFNIHNWENKLADVLSSSLAIFRNENEDEMEMFAVDCHPWNGIIALAFLTHSELKDAPYLSEASEIAAWKNYNFTAKLETSESLSTVGLEMRTEYETSGGDKSSIVKLFLRSCAAAVASKKVQDVLSTYRLSGSFKITIPHPDSNEEYFIVN